MRWIAFFLFFLITSAGNSIEVKKGFNESIRVDFDQSEEYSYRVYQRDNIIDVYYLDFNLSIQRNDNSVIQELKNIKNNKFILKKRIRDIAITDKIRQKTIQVFLDSGKVRERVFEYQKHEGFNGLTPIIPNVGEGTFSDGVLIQDRVFKATEDCLTLEIISQGVGLNVIELISDIQDMNFNWDDYIDFHECGDVCKSGMSRLSCPDNPSSIKCPIDMKKVLLDGLKEKLSCLSKMNPELTAQVLGVLFNKDRKLFLHCQGNAAMKGAYGYSRANCTAGYPNIKVAKIGCRLNSRNEDSPMIFNQEAAKGTLFHELLHTTGQSHGEHPDFSYACQAACMDISQDSLSRYYPNGDSPEALAVKQAGEVICRNELSEDETSEYVQKMKLITRNLGSEILFHEFLGRSLTSAKMFSSDPLELFESLWSDSTYFADKKRAEKRIRWEPPEGEWKFCQSAISADEICLDPDGELRAKFFKKIISDKSFTPMLIGMLMYSPNTKSLRSDLVTYLSSERPAAFVKQDDLALTRYQGVLKDVMIVSDLKRIGSKLSGGNFSDALKELSTLKDRNRVSIVRDGTNLAHDEFYRNFKAGIEKQMKSICIENIGQVKEKPIILEICREVL